MSVSLTYLYINSSQLIKSFKRQRLVWKTFIVKFSYRRNSTNIKFQYMWVFGLQLKRGLLFSLSRIKNPISIWGQEGVSPIVKYFCTFLVHYILHDCIIYKVAARHLLYLAWVGGKEMDLSKFNVYLIMIVWLPCYISQHITTSWQTKEMFLTNIPARSKTPYKA